MKYRRRIKFPALPHRLDFLDNLDDIFVVEDVFFAHLLRLMLDGRSPHQGAVN